VVGASLSLMALFLVGFVVYLYGLSTLAERSSQVNLHGQYGAQLAAQIAPTGPANEGEPVAILHLPGIGLPDAVVVEGTTGSDLAQGPGHRVDTVLPGQDGVSVIYGKAATYGAPFARLEDLRQGDQFTVTTQQGTFTYVVYSFGDATAPPPADSNDRLVLTTADSSFVPTMTVSVNADLVGPPMLAQPVRPELTDAEVGLASDPDALVGLLLWTQVFLVVVIAAVLCSARWARVPTYLCFTPIVAAAAWNVYASLAALLPNVY
jgi:LPXTG-site transpeptidase (sortase) family protein